MPETRGPANEPKSLPKTLSKTKLHKVKCIGIVCYSVRPFSTRHEGQLPSRAFVLDLPNEANLLKKLDLALRKKNQDFFQKFFFRLYHLVI
jgi:hypothetical protein